MMWTVILGVVAGSGSMLVGIFVGYALAERGRTMSEQSESARWN